MAPTKASAVLTLGLNSAPLTRKKSHAATSNDSPKPAEMNMWSALDELLAVGFDYKVGQRSSESASVDERPRTAFICANDWTVPRLRIRNTL